MRDSETKTNTTMLRIPVNVVFKYLGSTGDEEGPTNYASVEPEGCPWKRGSCLDLDELHDSHYLCPYLCGFQIDLVHCKYFAQDG